MKAMSLALAAAAFALGSTAYAADPAPAAKPATAPAAAKPAAKPAAAKPVAPRKVGDNSASKPGAKPRTAISIDCSKQADAKGLHGKEREKFRAACKKGK